MPTPFVKRPTSPLEAEPLRAAPEDVLLPGSDDELSAEFHRNKRRRIEAHGQKYLEGKPLFIQSASLRGPLDTGWINPWKRKPRQTKGGILRIPHHKDIVDLTESQMQHVPPALDIRPSAANLTSRGNRASVISDLGPRVTRAFETVERRARSTEDGGKPILRGGIQSKAKQVLPRAEEWIKSDTKYLIGGRKPTSNSPTPTPGARQPKGPRSPIDEIAPRTPGSQEAQRPPILLGQRSEISPESTTPTNPARPPTAKSHDIEPDADIVPSPQLRTEAWVRQNTMKPPKPPNRGRVGYIETVLDQVDETTRLGFYGAKTLSQEAVRKTLDEEAHEEARRLSQEAAFLASQSAIAPEPVEQGPKQFSGADSKPPSSMQKAVLSRDANGVAERLKLKLSKDTPRAVPPSSNLSEFQYRKARKEAQRLETTAKQSPFAQALQAAKANAEAKTIKHLSFTASGGIRSFGSRSTSRASSVETARSRANRDPTFSQEDGRRKSGLATSASDSRSNGEDRNPPSNVLPEGPEAQIQPLPVPSGPSTNVLETDKQSLLFPSTEEGEGDSYMNLSTQAALAKAQQSFKDNIISPVKDSPKSAIHPNTSQPSPTAYKTPNVNLRGLPKMLTEELTDNDQLVTLKEALNTQAMIDAISPFALTTVKKQLSSHIKSAQLSKKASFAHSPLPSPSEAYGAPRRSLSMSTSSRSPSPSPSRRSPKRTPASRPPPLLSKASTGISKPVSTSTSTIFSIAPNGTLTEVYQQDGQQQHDVGIGPDSSWDLDQALEEAGSFLETLDVEAEAKKGGTALVNGSRA
ncbi:hypothetical protein G7Y79_00014g036160 [Physcia stellaris]|nr:hypothetical protein G7Y79_00014g036160 [Physcia stellaris]